MTSRPLSLARSVWDRLLDFFLPAHCFECGRQIQAGPLPYFCPTCWEAIPRITQPHCPICGVPFHSPAALEASPTHCCGACMLKPPRFDRARAAAPYATTLQTAIHLFKYQGKHSLAKPLAKLLSPLVKETQDIDILIPVPLHPRRLRQRGFNQAALLAHRLSRSTGLPMDLGALARVRWTIPQVALDGEARQRNLRGAFALGKPSVVAGRRVALVDDVFTTGATAQECTRVLKKGGARVVSVLTLARSVPW